MSEDDEGTVWHTHPPGGGETCIREGGLHATPKRFAYARSKSQRVHAVTRRKDGRQDYKFGQTGHQLSGTRT